MSNAQKHLKLLGMRVREKVTGLEGVVTSICFDLYGCIQGLVHPGLDADGKVRDQSWFDISRLDPVSTEPVMRRPDYIDGPTAEGKQGAAEKPAPSSN